MMILKDEESGLENYLWSIRKLYGWQVSRVINIAAGSAKLVVNVPELNGRF